MPGRSWKTFFKSWKPSKCFKNSRTAISGFFNKYVMCCFSNVNDDENTTNEYQTSFQTWCNVPPALRITIIQIIYGLAIVTLPQTSAIAYENQELPFDIDNGIISGFARDLLILDGRIFGRRNGEADSMIALNWIRKWCSLDVINNVPAIGYTPDGRNSNILTNNGHYSSLSSPSITSLTSYDQSSICSNHLIKQDFKTSLISKHWINCMSIEIQIMDGKLKNHVQCLASDCLYPVTKDNHRVVLGSGSYGQVCLNRLGDCNGKLVAVKAITTTNKSNKFNRFIDKLAVSLEARIMKVLSQESDVFPRVYGVCEAVTSDTQWAIVMEFVGDSTSFKSTSLMKALASGSPHITTVDCFHIILDIAEGIEILQKNSLIHNDLASRNILLYNKGPRISAKIVDFGSVCTAEAPFDFFQLNDTDKADVFDLMQDHLEHAPELYNINTPPTFASDIYSFGVIIEGIAANKALMPLMDISGPCLHSRPDQRPAIEDLIDHIEFELFNFTKNHN
ncbi:hepatocyte growth factor receptor-like [Antedon mediterranea]|uniref:hepatocyte growth factor receptor-like n=1 Tax=Antedon mediterranea TaxID=105859 RepID=UPI003AF73EFB